jgi:hypothetical protein
VTIPTDESVFYACQAAKEHQQRLGYTTEWLILGDDEYARLVAECQTLSNAGYAHQVGPSVAGLTQFQGMHVAHYHVPSHLEVIGVER